MDMTRNSRARSQTVFECSGQGYDPEDPKLHAACSQTWHNRLQSVDSRRLENALLSLVRYLIRGKWFDEARVCGCLAVAVDGTLQEFLTSFPVNDGERAKLIAEWGAGGGTSKTAFMPRSTGGFRVAVPVRRMSREYLR